MVVLGRWAESRSATATRANRCAVPPAMCRREREERREREREREKYEDRERGSMHAQRPRGLYTGVPRDPKPVTRNPEPGTWNPKPATRNPKPEIRNPKPETRNPKPKTQNPKPNLQPPKQAVETAVASASNFASSAQETIGDPRKQQAAAEVPLHSTHRDSSLLTTCWSESTESS